MATESGTVIFAKKLKVHGNTIMINHGWGIVSVYNHCDQLNVKETDKVKKETLLEPLAQLESQLEITSISELAFKTFAWTQITGFITHHTKTFSTIIVLTTTLICVQLHATTTQLTYIGTHHQSPITLNYVIQKMNPLQPFPYNQCS